MIFTSSYKLFWFSRYLIFVLTFLVIQKKQLDQKDRVNFKFHDITTWLKTITIYILSNISRIKGNQIMKIGQLIDIPRKTFFFKNHAENEAGRLVSDLLLFKKGLYEVKASRLQLHFNIIWQPSTIAYNKNKLYETLDY